ncbi:ABC transporter substrate binding protein [Bradyrhizobium sp. UFLA05-153]
MATWPLAVHAQRPKNMPRLCFLTFDPDASRSTRFGPFFDGLRDLGYVDGQTISIDYLSADGHGERFPTLAAECLRLKADIIVASTTPATQVAKTATRTIPIVMLALADPVAAGLVNSVARPGANVTGSSMMISELSAKRLALLKEIAPKISRVLVLAYPADPIAAVQVKALKEAAPSLGLMLQVQDIQTADDLPAAFDAGAKESAEGLIVGAESIFLVYRARVTELAARYRLPAIYPFSMQVTNAGGLMAYGARPWQRFWYITWPLLLPVTMVVVLFSVIQSPCPGCQQMENSAATRHSQTSRKVSFDAGSPISMSRSVGRLKKGVKAYWWLTTRSAS